MKKKEKNKDKKKDKEDTLTKILILIIFLLFVFYLPDIWKSYDIPARVNRAIWESGAEENLEAHFYGIEGDEYVFIEGLLISTCKEVGSENHCPRMFTNKAQMDIYYEDNKFYNAKIREFWNKEAATYKISELKNLSVMSFLEKNNEINLELKISEYIRGKKICGKMLYNDTTCSISQNKKFKIENISKKRNDITINITLFEIKKTNTSIKAEVAGRIYGDVVKPLLDLKIYSLNAKTRRLSNQENLILTPESTYYTFNTHIIFPITNLKLGNYTGPGEGNESATYDYNTTSQDYSILLLLRDQDYFYAKEKIIKENTIEEKTYK